MFLTGKAFKRKVNRMVKIKVRKIKWNRPCSLKYAIKALKNKWKICKT